MKFSIETLQEIQKLLAADFACQIEAEEVKAGELEQVLSSSLQAIGQASYGEMQSMLDEQRQDVWEGCSCGQMGR